MPKLTIPQLGREITVDLTADGDANLMKTLMNAGIPVASSCNGEAVCGKCKLLISGAPGAATKRTEAEVLLVQKLKIDEKFRLSCQVQVKGDLEVRSTYW